MIQTTTVTTILVFEPNTPFLDMLRTFLKNIGISKASYATSLAEAENNFRKYAPKICILNAAQADSYEFATNVRKSGSSSPFIFLGSSRNQEGKRKLIESFGNCNFLDNDLSASKLSDAIKYALLQLENSWLSQQVLAENNPPKQVEPVLHRGKNARQLFFKIGDSFRSMDKEKISFFFAENKMTYARVGKRNFPTNVQLKTLEKELFPQFLRAHKKYLVNTLHIESISTRNDLIKINEEELRIGYSYRKSLLGNLNLLR